MPACFLFPLYLSALLANLSIFFTIILFFLFLPLRLLQFVLTFFGFVFFQHDHIILEEFYKFSISSPCNTSLIPLCVLFLQHSPYLTGPYIFLTIFLSNTPSMFISSIITVQVFLPTDYTYYIFPLFSP